MRFEMPRKRVFLNWEVGSNFGWGVLGLNVFSHWARDPTLTPLSGSPIDNDTVRIVDPLRLSAISNAITASNQYLEILMNTRSNHVNLDATVINPISHGFAPSRFFGKKNIARCIFENADTSEFDRNLQEYDALLCGSNWNAEILKSGTGRDAKVILEGIDPSLFCPGPRSGLMNPEKFYVFSGGKIEARKAQDLVLVAFREFATRHRDAILVTAWHSPWDRFVAGFKGKLDAPLELDQNGFTNIKKWAVDNGIDPRQFIEIFSTPNQLMPMILREMDVALQPSRAEACTNLPVKEAMGCGVPVIVGNNTGMKDLITEDNCVALLDQRPVTGISGTDTTGWGESNVDEIVDALEMLYGDRKRRKRVGDTASRWVSANRTWQKHAAELKEFVLSLD
ncbi:MAG: glycosyltransferase family 4 protein [Casimicrobiaceae bacterium]